MLTNGFNHVAILTNDSARLHAFYEEVFEAEVLRDGPETPADAGVRLSIVHVGPHSELNVFEIDGNTEAERQTPMFARGRIDHLAYQAESLEAFETIRERLIARGRRRQVRHRLRPGAQRVLPRPRRARVRSVCSQPRRAPGGVEPTRYARSPLSRPVVTRHRALHQLET